MCSSPSWDIHIFAIAETWLSSDIFDSELIIPGYNLFCCDRDRHGGGVAIYVHSSLTVSLIPLPQSDIELILLKVGVVLHPLLSAYTIDLLTLLHIFV